MGFGWQKKIFVFLGSIFITSNVFAYSLLYVGEVESRDWNDVWNKFYDYPLKVYAGADPDGSERTILIKIKNSFGDDFNEYFEFKKCNEKQIKKDKCYKNGYKINKSYDSLIGILEKSIEWSMIAKENNVEKVSKDIKINGKRIYSPFGGGYARFFAQGTHQSDLILPTFFHLSDSVDRYYSLEAQKNFLEHLTKVDETIERSMKENQKAKDLFN